MNPISKTFERFKADFEKVIGESESKLADRISVHLENFFIEVAQAIENCESPIEKLISLELNQAIKQSRLERMVDVIEVIPQAEVEVYEGRPKERLYRVDLLVRLTKFISAVDSIEYAFAIECDGHDYHERTKEQAARDRQRERDLMNHGIAVIRFTGSEIYDDPFGCAREAIQIMEHYVQNIFRF